MATFNEPSQLSGAPGEYRITITNDMEEVIYQELALMRQYQTGSWGWHTAGKFPIEGTDGERAQVNVALTVIGSKKWKP